MEYDNTNRGAIWENHFRVTDTDPFYKGPINVEGTDYVLRLWPKKDGAKPNAPDYTITIRLKSDDFDETMPF